MVEFRETVTVDAPVADVARVLHAVERWPSWTASVSRVERSGSGPLAMSEPLARVTALLLAPLIRRYVRLEAEGLRRDVQRPAAG